MKALRRWLVYCRLLDEVADALHSALTELGVQRKAMFDFARHWADAEADRMEQPRPLRLRRVRRAAIQR